MKALIVAAIACLSLSGCDSSPPVTKRYIPVRVFMHSPGTYSFLVKKQDSKELEAYGIFYHCTIIADVPEHEEMWAEVTMAERCTLVGA
jgi:hypothetical protein